MTNPHPTNATNIDIRATADRIIGHLRQGQNVEAFQMLERERAEERAVVQEALDRYVVAGARNELSRVDGAGMPDAGHSLERLRQAGGPPRIPEYNRLDASAPNELIGLTASQKYDVYASMVESRGSDAVIGAIRRHESVILGLRRETSTVASMDDPRIPGAGEAELHRGTGVYDDHIVVLRRDAEGGRHLFIADRANTEPTAQYDAHARPAPGREATPYADVVWRRSEGERADGDTTPDLGRMAEGTFEMLRTTHPAREVRNDFSLRPTPEQASAPRNASLIQRDTNGDGWFTQGDIDGVQSLNDSFKIHAGSRYNTDSAGCQTIHRDDYDDFIRAVRANERQDRWQYVLTSTEGGLFHDVNRGNEQGVQPQRLQPQQRPVVPAEERQQRQPPEVGSLNDLPIDRYLIAALSGDSASADRAATEFARSAEVRKIEAQGEAWLSQHQIAEQAQSQDWQMAR